jgi:protein subunit release factor A
MKVAIEIRPGEGGDDAKLLVADQAAIYERYAKTRNLVISVEDDSRS